MKLATSFLLCSALLCSIANAQTFEIEAGTGATLEGNTILVNAGQTFSVKVFMNMQGATTSTSFGAMALAYATAGSSSNRLSFLSGSESTFLSSTFTTAVSNGSFFVRDAALFDPGNYSTASGLLPRVVYHFKGVTQGSYYSLSGRKEFATFTFGNTLGQGEVWGDSASETGLFLAFQNRPIPQTGASGVSTSSLGSSKYLVRAVPEPATLLVLGAGLLGFGRKRRRTT